MSLTYNREDKTVTNVQGHILFQFTDKVSDLRAADMVRAINIDLEAEAVIVAQNRSFKEAK